MSRPPVALLLLSLLLLTTPSFSQTPPADSPTARADAVPKAKQTTLGLYATAAEAYDRWKADPEHVKIIDVRIPEEYIFVGHADMAWNIPYTFQTYAWDAEKEHFAMRNSPDFVANVRALVQAGDTLYLMCRSGTRSSRAVNALAEAGFTNVYSIVDGMEGDAVKDPGSASDGKRVINGWKNAGLPWTYEIDPARMRLPATAASEPE